MTTTMHTPESLRELIAQLAEDLDERGAFPEGLVLDTRGISNPRALAAYCSNATQVQLEQALRAINVAESAALKVEERDQLWAEEEARRNAPPTEAQLQEAAEQEERARVAYEYSRSVPGLLERLLATNEEILTELRKR